MKIVWKGGLSFGLVNIPIGLYSAIQTHVFGFTMLHEKCKTPINYKRWCSHCKKEIDWNDIVKGLKQNDDSYVVFTKEAIEKIKPEKTDNISIIEVLKSDLIEPIYYESHYYLAPQKKTESAYYLFRKALEELHMTAIGQFVMRDKQYVCAIQPYKDILLLSTLNYEYEIRSLENVKGLLTQKPTYSKQELTLAIDLIKKLTVKKFDISDFKDTYVQELKELIKKYAKGKKIIKKKPVKKEEKTKNINLIDSLRKSIKHIPAKQTPASRPVARAKGAKGRK